jgi:hypothetical protein
MKYKESLLLYCVSGWYAEAFLPTGVPRPVAPYQHGKFGTKGATKMTENHPLQAVGIASWFASLSYVIIQNYKIGPWPMFLPSLLRKQSWVLMHAVSNMFFAGGIILSSIMEFLVVRSRNPPVIRYWYAKVSSIERGIVLPALTCSIVSGFMQAAIDYGSMTVAPKHIRLAIHILITFAMWWIATDWTTQQAVKTFLKQEPNNGWWGNDSDDEYTNSIASSSPPRFLFLRQASNLISCLFVMSLYALMALKPGYSPP